jgi:hypothetical protein
LISEATVPESRPALKGRIYAEIDGAITTGFAVANPNDTDATISFHFTSADGSDFGHGSVRILAHGQIARFLNQAPFNGPESMRGTFTFTSNVPVAAIALRGFTNERNEFLITTLSVADPEEWNTAPVYFPHFADGAGWTTQFVLVNPTDSPISGTLRFLSQGQTGSSGSDMSLTIDGRPTSAVPYTLAPRSSQRFTTSGTTTEIRVGSAQVIPNGGNPRPEGTAIFSYKTRGVTVSQAGIASSAGGKAFRMYAEVAADSIRTGVAVNNTTSTEAEVNFELTRMDGTSTGLRGSVKVPAHGQRGIFLNEIAGLQSLSAPFSGIMRITSATNITASGLRTRLNERGSFLFTTTAARSELEPAANQLVFPHIADGGGYTTQFILFSGSAGQPQSGDLEFHSQSGGTLSIGLTD